MGGRVSVYTVVGSESGWYIVVAGRLVRRTTLQSIQYGRPPDSSDPSPGFDI